MQLSQQNSNQLPVKLEQVQTLCRRSVHALLNAQTFQLQYETDQPDALPHGMAQKRKCDSTNPVATGNPRQRYFAAGQEAQGPGSPIQEKPFAAAKKAIWTPSPLGSPKLGYSLHGRC